MPSKGIYIQFNETPKQSTIPKEIRFSENETKIINDEINKLIDKGVIKQCGRELGDFVSRIFIRKKKEDSYRLILDLSPLNKYVEHHHSKWRRSRQP